MTEPYFLVLNFFPQNFVYSLFFFNFEKLKEKRDTYLHGVFIELGHYGEVEVIVPERVSLLYPMVSPMVKVFPIPIGTSVGVYFPEAFFSITIVFQNDG